MMDAVVLLLLAIPGFIFMLGSTAIVIKFTRRPVFGLLFYLIFCVAIVIDMEMNFDGISYPHPIFSAFTSVPAVGFFVMAVTGIYALIKCFRVKNEY